jgi:DNA-binding MarR family transcriptional regulator
MLDRPGYPHSVPMPEEQHAEARGTPDELAFVEEFGRLLEEEGAPRIAGRILGWLLICEPPHQSFNDLVDVLGASKGSVSSMTRLLLEMEVVERFTRPGDRQTYFRLRPDNVARFLRRRMRFVEQMAGLAERGLAVARGAHPGGDRVRLEEMLDFYRFMAQRFASLVEDYERERSGPSTA